MGLPKEYNDVLHDKTGFYAAWFPITTPAKLGDYGLVRDGVFEKMGHLDQLSRDGFDVAIESESGKKTKVDLLSRGARAVAAVAGASVPVGALPTAGVNAKLSYEFDKANSFVVKAATVDVEQMANVAEVAKGLDALRRRDKWWWKYRVVSKVYVAERALVLLATEKGTKVELEGDADALRQIDLGNVTLKSTVSSSSDSVLKIEGDSGALGLGFFRLKLIGSGPKTLAAGGTAKGGKPVIEEKWKELEDDL